MVDCDWIRFQFILIALSERAFGIEFGAEDLVMESFANLRRLAGVIAIKRARLPVPREIGVPLIRSKQLCLGFQATEVYFSRNEVVETGWRLSCEKRRIADGCHG